MAQRQKLGERIDRHLESVQRCRPHAHAKDPQCFTRRERGLDAHSLSAVTPALIATKRDALLAESLGNDKTPRKKAPATANRRFAVLGKAMSNALRGYY